MAESISIPIRHIARRLRLSARQVEAVAQLLEEGKTVPFIARYRKDQTGGLQEEQIRRIRRALEQARLLVQRKEAILRSIQLQGKLTPELELQIRTATTARRLEDLYLPYKPKKEGLGTQARNRGLEPLAEEILQAAPSCADLEARAADFVNPDKHVHTPADALLGAGHILAEMISEHANLRKKLREVFYTTARICSRLRESVQLPADLAAQLQAKKVPAATPEVAPSPEESAPLTQQPSQVSPTSQDGSSVPEAPPERSAPEASGASGAPAGPGPEVAEAAQPPVAPPESDSLAGPSAEQREKTSSLDATLHSLPESAASETPGSELPETSRVGSNDSGEETTDLQSPPSFQSDAASSSRAESAGPVASSEAQEVQLEHSPGGQEGEAEGEEGNLSLSGVFDSGSALGAGGLSESSEARSPDSAGEPDSVLPPEEIASGQKDLEGVCVSSVGQPGGHQPTSPPAQSAGVLSSPAPLSKAELRRQQKELKKQRAWERRLRAYSAFFDFQESVRKISPYRILCLNRAERHKIVRVWIECDREALKQVLFQECVPPDHPHADFLRGCAEDALDRLLLPSLQREARREVTEKAELHAVDVVGKSLQKMLLQRPVRGKRILAIDPGVRNGCMAVALDEFGNVLEHMKFYLVGRSARREELRQKLLQMIRRYRIGLVVIGNGPGCRITERFFAELINTDLKTEDVHYGTVPEIGAHVYGVSAVGQEEFPYYDARLRATISIGRRVLDPLSELVKIEPAYLVTGPYQEDAKAKHLQPFLQEVVESCVNRVGVDVNTAHPWLLRYISGLNMILARRIEEYRREHGPFRTRADLKQIPGFGEGTFELAAGFLRIPYGPEVLDRTSIHPDWYELARRILEKLAAKPEQLWDPASRASLLPQLEQLDPENLSQELAAGGWTVREILAELRRAGRDIREDAPVRAFKRPRLQLDELKPDMEFKGTVVHIVSFGAFVDIGATENGLVHISQMAPYYVRDPRDLVSVGDSIAVWILQVDPERRRISLSMIPPEQRAEGAPIKSAERASERQAPRPSVRAARVSGTSESSTAAPKAHPSKRKEAARAARTSPTGPSRREFRSKAPPPPPPKLSEAVKQGKQPMRTFAELVQFFQLSRHQQAAPATETSPTRSQLPQQPACSASEDREAASAASPPQEAAPADPLPASPQASLEEQPLPSPQPPLSEEKLSPSEPPPPSEPLPSPASQVPQTSQPDSEACGSGEDPSGRGSSSPQNPLSSAPEGSSA